MGPHYMDATLVIVVMVHATLVRTAGTVHYILTALAAGTATVNQSAALATTTACLSTTQTAEANR